MQYKLSLWHVTLCSVLNNAFNMLSWCTCTLPNVWNHVCLFCTLRCGYLFTKHFLLQEILFCTVAITADIRGKDRGDILANGLNGPTKWKRMAFLFRVFPVSFPWHVIFLHRKLFGEERQISSDPHKPCIIFLVLSQTLYVTLACHPIALSSPTPQMVAA